jgi:hypothetical protein
MSGKIEPLQPAQVPALSEFIRTGFCTPGSYCAFAEPEVIRWKYFEERGPWNIPRSFLVSENNRILAHAGLFSTAFESPGSSPIPAVHIIDWRSSEEAGSLGALLMMRAFSLAPVTYALGCTAAASRVLLRSGFEVLFSAPIFHRVINRLKPSAWHELHGTQTLARKGALLGIDLVQSLRPTRPAGKLQIREVASFGDDVREVLARGTPKVTSTSRSPEVLNHYLRFPLKNFTGYLFEDDRVRGFAVLTVLQKPALRAGRIVECYLDSDNPSDWTGAIALLEAEMRKRNVDLISMYGTTPWSTQALRSNGFFRRGRTPFYLRDPKKLVPRALPFHLTHLEADLSFI